MPDGLQKMEGYEEGKGHLALLSLTLQRKLRKKDGDDCDLTGHSSRYIVYKPQPFWIHGWMNG